MASTRIPTVVLSELQHVTDSLNHIFRDTTHFDSLIQHVVAKTESLAADIERIENESGESAETVECRLRVDWAMRKLKRCQSMPPSKKRIKVLYDARTTLEEIPKRLSFLRQDEVRQEERRLKLRDAVLARKLAPGPLRNEYQVPRNVDVGYHDVFALSHWTHTIANKDIATASGDIINGPIDLCSVELIRQLRFREYDLGDAVPVDLFVWKTAPPQEPFLTRLGGVPFRCRTRPWPVDKKGVPFTFVAQICFLDSKDLIPIALPGDVMLVFLRDSWSWCGWKDDVRIEWSNIGLAQPMTPSDCPTASFPVPELTGVIHRSYDFPDGDDIFEYTGHGQPYLLALTQGTKIGVKAFFIQGERDVRRTLICALNSLHPPRFWPFVDLEQLPSCTREDDHGWGEYSMSFGDSGCMYFYLDEDGSTVSYGDCY